MGDPRRFRLFAELVARRFPPHRFGRIADVAGGNGRLNRQLLTGGYGFVKTYDPRCKRMPDKRRAHYERRLFDESVAERFDVLVGLHPDGATDVVISVAATWGVPFVVCPCCVMPVRSHLAHPVSERGWVTHLRRYAEGLGFEVWETALPMSGRNNVLIGMPGQSRGR